MTIMMVMRRSGDGMSYSEVGRWYELLEGDEEVLSYADVLRGKTQPVVSSIAGNRVLKNGLRLWNVERRDADIVLTEEDIYDECEYWKHALIGYILGNSVPFMVIKKFVEGCIDACTLPP
ncbi:hypothetical protein Droror1_Dr00022607 [Drosera rotundifolia]